MDLSALIFVALAVAWATYLIPKALRHHEDSNSSRSVEGFSTRMRVLARREPIDSRSTRLVVGGAKPEVKPVFSAEATVEKRPVTQPVTKPVSKPVPAAVRRQAAARAAKRRLRVVLLILLAGVGVGVAAGLGRIPFTWLAAPAGVLLVWLVACRLMVRRERAVSVPGRRLPITVEPPGTPVVDEGDPVTEEIVAVQVELTVEAERAAAAAAAAASAAAAAEVREPDPEPVAEAEPAPSSGWDPVPTTLPTYVGKEPAARRTVRQIDLDSTGVWTSGPLASDSALAREADAERASRTTRDEDEKKRRASGS